VDSNLKSGATPHPKSHVETPHEPQNEGEDEVIPPRNFTSRQLRYFDGTKDEQFGEDKPVYLSLNGTVFDVSEGRNFYGPGGPYELFAGRECGASLAKMSFSAEYLDDMAACKSLNFGEKNELENWCQKFQHYRNYPIVGRLVPDSDLPDPTRVLTKKDLVKYSGEGDIPVGYASAPNYLGAGGKVYDVSFGGVTFYGKGCSYNRFAGKDASRALAKMSFDPKDTENTDLSDLSDKERSVLSDWIKTFEERKNYPVVGVLG